MNSLLSIITEYIDQAIEEFEKKPSSDGEESVLQKLLKIDKKVAIVMALDMMMAGVDTVRGWSQYLILKANLSLPLLHLDCQHDRLLALRSGHQSREAGHS